MSSELTQDLSYGFQRFQFKPRIQPHRNGHDVPHLGCDNTLHVDSKRESDHHTVVTRSAHWRRCSTWRRVKQSFLYGRFIRVFTSARRREIVRGLMWRSPVTSAAVFEGISKRLRKWRRRIWQSCIGVVSRCPGLWWSAIDCVARNLLLSLKIVVLVTPKRSATSTWVTP